MKDYSYLTLRVLNCLETISGVESLLITLDAKYAAIKLLEGIPNITDEDRFFIMQGALCLASANVVVDTSYSNKCRGAVVRNGITQHVVDSAKGEC